MAKMPQDCMDMINNVYAAAVATADANGVPNVVCCSMKQAYDDETVMISDQYMRKTLANVETGSKMAVSVWDETHGYQVKGSATYENEGERYGHSRPGASDPELHGLRFLLQGHLLAPRGGSVLAYSRRRCWRADLLIARQRSLSTYLMLVLGISVNGNLR